MSANNFVDCLMAKYCDGSFRTTESGVLLTKEGMEIACSDSEDVLRVLFCAADTLMRFLDTIGALDAYEEHLLKTDDVPRFVFVPFRGAVVDEKSVRIMSMDEEDFVDVLFDSIDGLYQCLCERGLLSLWEEHCADGAEEE